MYYGVPQEVCCEKVMARERDKEKERGENFFRSPKKVYGYLSVRIRRKDLANCKKNLKKKYIHEKNHESETKKLRMRSEKEGRKSRLDIIIFHFFLLFHRSRGVATFNFKGIRKNFHLRHTTFIF